jgi:hypothetical protein
MMAEIFSRINSEYGDEWMICGIACLLIMSVPILIAFDKKISLRVKNYV